MERRDDRHRGHAGEEQVDPLEVAVDDVEFAWPAGDGIQPVIWLQRQLLD
jgi:hypothetical protein